MQTIQRIGIIGAGAWGTALAKHLSEKGLRTVLWAYERDVVDSIRNPAEVDVQVAAFAHDIQVYANAKAFDAMPMGSHFINVSRGEIAMERVRDSC